MKNIMAEFAGYPQMELLLNLLDQLPYFYQTLLYNVARVRVHVLVYNWMSVIQYFYSLFGLLFHLGVQKCNFL